MLKRITETLRGNPVLTRHLATTFTGPRLAIAFLLVTGAMVALYGSLFVGMMDSMLPQGVIYFVHNTVLLAGLLILLPLKVSGVIEGPRLNRSFDQIVVTGVSPIRLMVGAWVSGLVYAVVLLFVTMPFAACLVLFGQTEIPLMLEGYGILLIYSNVIIAATLAASLFGREWITAPVVISVIALVGLFSCIPDRDVLRVFPPLVAEWTPLRLFAAQANIPEVDFQRLVEARMPMLLIWPIPAWLALAGSWLVFCLVAGLLFLVGPGHRFSPGLDNFGAVVLRGDGKRGFLGKLRGALTRRVEVGFLYENAAPWTRRWGGLIRYLLVALLVVLLTMLAVGSLWSFPFMRLRTDFYNDEYAIATLVLAFGFVGVWALIGSNTRNSALAPVPIGRFALPSELVYAVLFVGLLAVAYTCSLVPLESIRARTTAGARLWSGKATITAEDLAAYETAWTQMSLASCLLFANLFLLARLVSRWSNKFLRVRILTVLLWIVLLVLPVAMLGLIIEEEVSATWLPIATLCPGYLVPEALIDIPPGSRFSDYAQSHLILSAVLVVLLGIRYLPFRRRAATQVVTMVGVLVATAFSLPAQERSPETDSASKAASSPLVIETATRGFRGVVFDDEVDFFTVQVRNTGDRTLEGSCWIQRGETTEAEQPFLVSPNSARTIRLRGDDAGRGTRWRRLNGGPAQVRFKFGNQVVESELLDLVVAEANSRRVRQQRGKGGGRPGEQHLFVGGVGPLPEPWMKLVFEDFAFNVAECDPVEASPSVADYRGLEMLWTTVSALAQLDATQQQTLLDYVLMGGSVGLMGGVSATDLAACGVWQEVLRPTEQWTTQLDAIQLKHVRLPEGSDALTIEVSGESVPALHRRHYGAGTIAHVPFELTRSRVPASLVGDPKFWDRFDQAIFRDGFVTGLAPRQSGFSRRNLTWLGALGGYYVVYALLLFAGLFFFARRREHRRRVWWMVLVLPVLFLSLVPVLVGFAEQEPSSGSAVGLRLFHSGSTAGYYSGHLSVASGGKSRHRIEVRGERPLAWLSVGRFSYYGRQSAISAQSRIPLRRGDGGAFEGEFGITAWGYGRVLVAASDSLEKPVSGQAVFEGSKVRVVAQIPPELRDHDAYVILDRNGSMIQDRVKVDASGSIRWQQGSTNRVQQYGAGTLSLHQRFRIQRPGRPSYQRGRSRFDRALLALVPRDLHSTRSRMRSPDADLRQIMSRAQFGYMQRSGQQARVRETPDGPLETLDYEVILIELDRTRL